MNGPEANPNMEKKCPQCGASLPTGALEGLCPACLLKQGATADTAAPPEAAPFQPPTVEEVTRLFPQLEILGFIGKGGMGAVYKARQPALDRMVALKILPPQTAGGAGFGERFSREARALAKLTHPNIVAIYEFGQVDGLSFFIMEFVDGLNLRQLERAGKLSPREALQIVPQICEALQFAHDEGIVHRDIKPENILVDKKGRVKIADFGIAKILGREPEFTLTETRGVLGTPQYMAPEQVEKPQSVDHRADIFSLGVVFYEMLTGELPLGKFAPPSSRMGGVKVDVRLDEVVLRALEKEPELRYQHASQVKTAVETIANTAAPPPGPNAGVMAQAILAGDYELNIKSCIRRGWALVRGDFWPVVAITALMVALESFAETFGSSMLGLRTGRIAFEFPSPLAIVAWGPLMGGLCAYYLKKIRGEPTTIEMAFTGFTTRFLHLFLAAFVTGLLIWIGFLCLVLPGIYLMVAWTFTVPLVMDQRLDFWAAMELSRKVVTRHWWKLFGLAIVLAFLSFAGIFAFVVGIFVTVPVAFAALMYAYEDIFGAARRPADQPLAGTGPSGTVVLPGGPAMGPLSGGGFSKSVALGLGAFAIFIAVMAGFLLFRSHRQHRVEQWAYEQQQMVGTPTVLEEPPTTSPAVPELVFGPIIEQVIEFTNSSRRALNLSTGNFVSPAPGTDFVAGPDGVAALRAAGADLYFPPQNPGVALRLTALDWRLIQDAPSQNPNPENATLETISSEDIRQQLDYWNNEAWKTNGADPGMASLLSSTKARNLQKHEEDFADSNVKLFITRNGTAGVIQIASLGEDDPAGMKIRYKLVEQPRGGSSRESVRDRKHARDDFAARLEAASTISANSERDNALGQVARDAARAGQGEIAKNAIGQIFGNTTRDEAAHDSAILLAKGGNRKAAIEIARGIFGNTTRDQTLSELAR
jgi:predicted Ser/Thr protein kinase